MTARFFFRDRFETECTIAVELSADYCHAHVELDGDLAMGPGDEVQVHGGPVEARLGESFTLRRPVTVLRAGLLRRLWVRALAPFQLTSLYEIGFSTEVAR